MFIKSRNAPHLNLNPNQFGFNFDTDIIHSVNPVLIYRGLRFLKNHRRAQDFLVKIGGR